MDHPSVTPSPDPQFILGSKRRDRVAGIAIGIVWWVVGGLLAGLTKGMLLPLLLIAFIGHLIYIGRRPDGMTMLFTIIVTVVVFPVAVVMGAAGMCALALSR